MKKDKKIINVFIRAIYIMLALLIIASVAYISRYYYDIYIAQKQSDLLDEISLDDNLTIEKQSAIQEENSLDNINNVDTPLVTDIVDTNQTNQEHTITERMLKLQELQKQNSDIIGWIEIENTNINYPVLQCSDNDFYVTHNYKKERNISGAIFLDKNYVWNPPSSNLLIYGHNNQNGTMFQDLLKYKNKKFYEQHPIIRFTTNNEDSYYEIFSVFESQVYYKSQTDVFKYYYFVNAKNEEEYNEFVENSKKSSLYDTGKTAEYGEQLMTLSTCAYHTQDGRFVVVAKKLQNQ